MLIVGTGNLVWKSPQFDTVSEEAKDLIKKLIVVEPEDRWTAKQALEHPWIKKHGNSNTVHNSMMEGLRSLSAESKARLAAAAAKKD